MKAGRRYLRAPFSWSHEGRAYVFDGWCMAVTDLDGQTRFCAMGRGWAGQLRDDYIIPCAARHEISVTEARSRVAEGMMGREQTFNSKPAALLAARLERACDRVAEDGRAHCHAGSLAEAERLAVALEALAVDREQVLPAG